MIITEIKIDNLYSFKDVNVDLTYKRKPKNTSIDNEFLIKVPKFNFKRVVIISGTNASGKTSFGRVICGVQNFLKRGRLIPYLMDGLCDKNQQGTIELEFLTPSDLKLRKIKLTMLADKQGACKCDFIYGDITLNVSDSVRTARDRLNKVFTENSKVGVYLNSFDDRVSAFDGLAALSIPDLQWLYQFSKNEDDEEFKSKREIDSKLLFEVLSSFDSSIISVSPLLAEAEQKNQSQSKKDKQSKKHPKIEGYMVRFANNDKIILNLELNPSIDSFERFSKGTFDAIKMTDFLSAMMEQGHEDLNSATFMLDEKLAYSHSQLEQDFLNLLISHLGNESQFFYTTHNYDILDLGLPVHSYLFMKKIGKETSVVQAEDYMKKNDRSLLNYVKNDYFRTLPDTSNLFKLMKN